MLDAVVHLGAFGVVEPVERADQVAGDPPDPVEGGIVGLGASAAGASVVDDAVVAALWVTVDGVIDRAVPDAA